MTQYVLDIETTTDLDLVRLVMVYNMSTGEYKWANTYADVLNLLFEISEPDNQVFTWNGARFDWNIIKREFGVEPSDYEFKHVDLMIFAKMFLPDMPHSLRAQAEHWFPHQPEYWKHEPWEELGITMEEFYNDAPLSSIRKYCEQDCLVTAKVGQMLTFAASRLKAKWDHPMKVELKVAEITNRQVDRAVRFDIDKAHNVLFDIRQEMVFIETEVEPLMPVVPISNPPMPPKKQFLKDGTPSVFITNYIKKAGWTLEKMSYGWTAQKPGPTGMGTLICTLPLTSPLETKEKLTLGQQAKLKEFLLKEGWIPTMWNTKKTDKGYVRTSPRLTDKVTKEPCPNLEKMGVKWAEYLSRWYTLRARKNLLWSDKGTGLIPTAAESGGFIASDADTVGTPTGRYRHKGIVNIPRVSSVLGREFRSLFCAREGSYWVGWDAQSLEACMEAHFVYPYDPEYAQSLVSGSSDDGTDVHTRNMNAMGLPNRDVSKTFKYAVTYGAQPKKLAEQLVVSEARAQEWFDKFWDHNYGLKKLKADVEKEWESYDRKYIVGLDGRLIATRHKHALLNSKFQGAGAVVMKHAMLIADRRIRDKYPDCYGLIRYHDEEIWEVPKDTEVAEDVLKIGIQSIRDAGLFLNLNVALDGSGKIGYNWADVH